MTNEIKLKGYWWLPNNPETTVAGILTYIPQDKISLELIGSFDSDKSAIKAFFSNKSEEVIFGISSDSKNVTLINCSASGSLNLSCSFPIIVYTCQFIIIGTHIEGMEQNKLFKACVDFPLLSQWCPPCALSKALKFDNKNEIEATTIAFTTNRDSLNSTAIDDNTTLHIKSGINNIGDYYSQIIEQYTYLEICKRTDSSIVELLRDVFIFEQFLSFVTLQETKCSNIELYDKEKYHELADGDKIYHPIQLIYVQREYLIPKLKGDNIFLFNFDTIKEQYPNVIKKWFNEKMDLAPIRQHLIGSIKNKSVFSSVDFLIVIQSLEGFWWRFRDSYYKRNNNISEKKNTNLSTILKELISEFEVVLLIKESFIDVGQTVDSRHYYSHLMDRKKKKNIVDGLELFELTRKLRQLLICCLLHFIGFDYLEIDTILNKTNSNLLHSS